MAGTCFIEKEMSIHTQEQNEAENLRLTCNEDGFVFQIMHCSQFFTLFLALEDFVMKIRSELEVQSLIALSTIKIVLFLLEIGCPKHS